MTHDGLGKYLKPLVPKARGATDDIVGILKATKTDVVVSYLPVGSEMATKWYVEQVLEAGCAFINCIPVFIASEPYWAQRFAKRGLPIIGDDIKSQVGATIVHRILTDLFRKRGVRLDHTYQLNFGGNTDFLNMLERERLESKKISKTQAVTSQLGHPMPARDVHVGPSDYVPWLTDRKFCYIRMEGTTFGNVPLNCELKLEVWDSPNSAGVVIDAVRCAKLALDRGIGGALTGPASYFMKSPPGAIHRRRGARARGGVHFRRERRGRAARPEAAARAQNQKGHRVKIVIFGLSISSSLGQRPRDLVARALPRARRARTRDRLLRARRSLLRGAPRSRGAAVGRADPLRARGMRRPAPSRTAS